MPGTDAEKHAKYANQTYGTNKGSSSPPKRQRGDLIHTRADKKKTEKMQEKGNDLHVEDRDCSHLFTVFLLYPLCSPFHPPPPLLCTAPHPPSSAESHYRNTISNTSAQVFDRLQTNLYSGGKQKAAEIYLLSVEERNKLAREPWVTSELTRRWICEPCKCMERGDILHSVIQHIAACRIPLTGTAGTPYFCVVRMVLGVVYYAEVFGNYCRPKGHAANLLHMRH